MIIDLLFFFIRRNSSSASLSVQSQIVRICFFVRPASDILALMPVQFVLLYYCENITLLYDDVLFLAKLYFVS